MHKVANYEIQSGFGHTYTTKLPETPAKVAAKIELFLEKPDFLPKNKMNIPQ